MLKTRLISALILIPLVVYGVLFLSNAVFSLILGVILVLGIWEWGQLVPLQNVFVRITYTAILAALMWWLWESNLAQNINHILLIAFVWWLCALFWLSRPQLGAIASLLNTSLKMVVGALVIIPAWAALSTLHARGADGPTLTLVLLVMVWLADSGAYFAGRQWGNKKLAPDISPGKTWEGVYGGVLSSLVFAAIAGAWYSHSLTWTLSFMLVSMLAVMFSVVGDLVESLMKRQSSIKDSGNIIPGHGGIFDRIDSLVAAAPVFLLGFYWVDL